MYLTRHMQATKPMTYDGLELRPGQRFYATDVDAGYFVKCGRAVEVEVQTEPFADQSFLDTSSVRIPQLREEPEPAVGPVGEPGPKGPDDSALAGSYVPNDERAPAPARGRGRRRSTPVSE
jgi:hypothetical protein